jgi:hypothetical protein
VMPTGVGAGPSIWAAHAKPPTTTVAMRASIRYLPNPVLGAGPARAACHGGGGGGG